MSDHIEFEDDFTIEKDIPGKMQVSADAFCIGKMISETVKAIRKLRLCLV
ncbi:hypothetical protein KAR91_74300 [Candidatus Pacearchaeota archaeon]|nr:hypothetical protein [Candidatus Pacearchaeota archaeon]